MGIVDRISGCRTACCRTRKARDPRSPLHGLQRAFLCVTALILLGAASWGCADDPYSQHRIALRRQNIQETIQGMVAHDVLSVHRLEEARQRLRHWWEQDNEDFQKRMRTIGDDFW